jgi:S1-C subfamily serine protease
MRNDGGHGSGFSISKNFLVTNKHVIEGANKLTTFIDGEKDLMLWNYSPTFDVAILKLPVEIPPCKWFDSSQLGLAEQLYTVGWPNQPFGDSTITAGIYSRTNVFDGGLEFIQTDAPINPGNSGGPLVNKYGVVGMNTLKEVWSGENIPLEGLGNALSSKFLIPVVDLLIREGKITSSFPKTSSYYASQDNVPAPKITPALNLNEINQYLADLRVVKTSWEGCGNCSKEDLDRLIDSFNRQIAFCETLTQRLSDGRTPTQDDLNLWDAVVKMSYESSMIAQKLNQL